MGRKQLSNWALHIWPSFSSFPSTRSEETVRQRDMLMQSPHLPDCSGFCVPRIPCSSSPESASRACVGLLHEPPSRVKPCHGCPNLQAQEVAVGRYVDGAWILVLDCLHSCLRHPVAQDKPSGGEQGACWGLGAKDCLFLNPKKSNDAKYKPSLPCYYEGICQSQRKKYLKPLEQLK